MKPGGAASAIDATEHNTVALRGEGATIPVSSYRQERYAKQSRASRDARSRRMAALGQSFAFVARPISGGSERHYRPFGENGSAAHGSRLRARFLVFHTGRWDVSLCDHTETTLWSREVFHTIKRPFPSDHTSRRPDRRCEKLGNALKIASGGRSGAWNADHV